MKIGIFSDCHLGFAQRTKREKDALNAAQQAMQICMDEKADLILLAGDLFDYNVPSQETWHDAFKLYSMPKHLPKSEVKIKKIKSNEEINFQGIPIASIHGTHEYRAKEYTNALQILEKAGALIYFHAESLEIQKGNEKVFIHGLGGIPEKKALDALRLWNPEPVKGALNILVLHQSIKEFLPTEDPMAVTISLADLPKGFDLYVNGHLHWRSVTDVHEGKFLLTGATITTQMKRLEAESEKGATFYDTQTKEMSFKKISIHRQLFYFKLKFENASIEEIKKQVREKIGFSLKENKQSLEPLIRIKLAGSLEKGLHQSNIDLSDLMNEFEGKAFFSIDKNFFSDSFKTKINDLREMLKEKKSVSQLGLELLEKNLNETNFGNAFDYKRIFDLLSEGEKEKALEELTAQKYKK